MSSPEAIIFEQQQQSLNNGGKTSYYNLDPSCTSIQDLIEAKNMHWNIANIFKACYRLGSQEHSTVIRDLNKMKYFIDRHIALYEKGKT